MMRPPISTLFPYTTLFRSASSLLRKAGHAGSRLCRGALRFSGHYPRRNAEVVRLVRDAIDGDRYPFSTRVRRLDRKSTRLNSSHTVTSYAVVCLKEKKHNQ